MCGYRVDVLVLGAGARAFGFLDAMRGGVCGGGDCGDGLGGHVLGWFHGLVEEARVGHRRGSASVYEDCGRYWKSGTMRAMLVPFVAGNKRQSEV